MIHIGRGGKGRKENGDPFLCRAAAEKKKRKKCRYAFPHRISKRKDSEGQQRQEKGERPRKVWLCKGGKEGKVSNALLALRILLDLITTEGAGKSHRIAPVEST